MKKIKIAIIATALGLSSLSVYADDFDYSQGDSYQTGKEFGQSVTQAKQDIIEKTNNASQSMNQTYNDVKNKFSETANQIVDQAHKSQEVIKAKANDASDALSNMANSAQTKVQNFKKGFDDGTDQASSGATMVF
ncbi:hypothetical protein BZ13_1894 [Francisella philomiragia subsp. philomiragia ATCC 25015]|uniref:YtxH domain-containing protein n=1 Tax=Francisella philomiragia TaxID=28110 RepID=UPI0001AF7DF8|nr:YtxH domain-containing protein [Francisella philomiragia]AJI75687.1 hypothetical protein BZ13_1894 [Francisella philomiragia subsp. philomiragia ATCC 25015]EET21799.1 predicted protein [Francisella philomiragia subsp. philomiragia ATCC 25015]MBK2238969.1 YtxH domain-containing protein [Francisella philomiragia]